MYNPKDIQFEGKHDFKFVGISDYYKQNYETFSIGIYQLNLTANGKRLKPSKAIVRVKGYTVQEEEVKKYAEQVVKMLDNGEWDGRKSVFVRKPITK